MIIGAGLACALPLVVALIALARRDWVPVLDLAMTEFRVADVGGRNTPLIGLPGRIGTLPDQGSHPGPLSFWVLAPGYRLFGSSPWALEAATVLVALGWILTALWIGHRRHGVAGVAMVAAVVMVMIRGFGASVLTQPWNPYMPLFAWLVVLLATWSVLDGDDTMLIALAVAASFCAQTHIPYLLLAGSLGALAFGVAALRWRRTGQRVPRPLLVTLGVFALLWSAPLVDQLRRDPGNVRRLIDHFSSPSEDTLGLGGAFRLALRHLDVAGGFAQQLTGTERFLQEGFDPDGSIAAGTVMLVVWIAAAIGAATIGHRRLVLLHSLLGGVFLLGVVSMSRIFGPRWFYLTLWAWVTTALVLVAVAWTAVAVWRHARPAAADRASAHAVAAVAATIAIGLGVTNTVSAASTEHPEEHLGEIVEQLLPDTAAALDAEARYAVEFRDAYFFGSQAFALLSELRRQGFDARMDQVFAVPATSSRAAPAATADAAVVLVTGEFIDEWAADERFEMVAFVEPRSADELAEFDALRSDLIAELESSGLDDLVPLVDENLFGLNIDQRIGPRSAALSKAMIDLGQRTAVFVGPPGVIR